MAKVCRKFLGYPSQRVINELQRREERKNVYFHASDGEIVAYDYNDIKTDTIPLNVLQYRGNPNYCANGTVTFIPVL